MLLSQIIHVEERFPVSRIDGPTLLGALREEVPAINLIGTDALQLCKFRLLQKVEKRRLVHSTTNQRQQT